MIDSVVVWVELPCVDRMLFTDAPLSPGAKIVVPRSVTRGGGVGGNFAAALRLFQMKATAVGLSTMDPLALTDYEDLRARGIHMKEVPSPSGSVDPIVCTLIVPDGTDRTIIIEYPTVGSSDYAALRAGFVSAVHSESERGDVGVYLGVLREQPAAALLALGSKPRAVACTLETSDWPTSETATALAWMDVVFVAEETYLDRQAEIAAWQLQHSFDLILTLGAKGARSELRDGTVESFSASEPLGKVVDTSGAGDCFAATYCAHLWGGSTHRNAVFAAGNVAAHHTTDVGARVAPDLLIRMDSSTEGET